MAGSVNKVDMANMADCMYFVPRGEEDTALKSVNERAALVVKASSLDEITVEAHILEDSNMDAPHLGTVGDVLIRLIPDKTTQINHKNETLYLPFAEVCVYRQRNRASHNWRLLKAGATVWTIDNNGSLAGNDNKDLFETIEEAIRWAVNRLEEEAV